MNHPQANVASVQDLIAGLLFRYSDYGHPESATLAAAFLKDNLTLAYAQYSVALLEDIQGRLVEREDMDHVRLHLDLCKGAASPAVALNVPSKPVCSIHGAKGMHGDTLICKVCGSLVTTEIQP